MPGVVETSPSLLTALLEHARTLLHLDHALFADWNEEEGTTTIVAAVGVLPGREVSAVGVPFPISDYYGSQTEMTDALPLMEPMLLQRSDRDLPPLLAAYMDRVGIAQELYVHLDADPPRRWVLECMYADPDQAVGSAERERALELARLAKAVIESERMAAALRDDEARQRMLVEALPVLVYQIDEHDRATVPSPGPLVVKLGSGPQEWQSDPYRHWLEHMHPDDRDRILASWRQSKRGRLRFDDEYRMVGADGRVAWVRDTAVPVLDIDATELVWHGVIMDITDRVEVAERLRMSEESHRALVERVPAMVYVQHTYDRSTVLNLGGFPAMLGYSDDEWVDPDRTWVELVHPGDVARVETAWHGAWAARQPFEEEYRLVGRNGRVVWVRDSALPTSGTDWHGITFDVTDLVETAERLREAQSRYQSLVEQIPVVTYLDDPTGKGIYVSPQVEGMLGVPVERWLGTYDAWLQAVHPDDAPLVDQRFRGMLERGAWFDAEYRVVLPDGTMRWVHDRARPIHDAEGNVSLVQGVIVDVTDRRLVAHATEQQARRQRAIADLGMMALEGLESKRLCDEAATAAMETLGGCGSGVFRSDGGDLLELIAGAGVVRDEPLCFRPTISGGSPAGQALVSDQPVICEDLEAETRFTVCSQIIGLGLRSCACVKIAGAGRPYGVLAVYSRRPSTFGSDDIDFLQAIANVLAAALERERVQAALELSEQQRQRVLAELLRSAD